MGRVERDKHDDRSIEIVCSGRESVRDHGDMKVHVCGSMVPDGLLDVMV
jgi:hypothetical protein